MKTTRTRAAEPAPAGACVGAALLRARAGMVADAYTRARVGDDVRGLHDLRVAARQWRATARLLDPCAGGALDRLRRDLGRLTRALGDWRDAEVQAALGTGAKPERDRALAAVRLAVARRLARADWRGVMARLRRLAARPRLTRKRHRPCTFDREAARALARAYDRLARRRTDVMWRDSESVHDFRRRVRLVRYWADLTAERLGADVEWLGRRLHELSTALGEVHDWDVYRARLERAGGPLSRDLMRVAARRRDAVRRAHGACERIWDGRRGRRARKALRTMREGENE